MSASALNPVAAAVFRGEGERPLRVCYVSADYPATSRGVVAGFGAHTYAIAHAIGSLGHDVSVVTESPDGPERFADGPVTVHAVPRGSTRMWKLGRLVPVPWLRRSFAAWRALRRLHRERPFDLVVFPDGYGEGFRYSFSPLAPFAVRLGGPASVVQRWDGRSVPPARARMERWMERRPAARAALLQSATRRFAETMVREWDLDPARIRIIRNPLDLARFHPIEGSARPAKRVLFVGHLQRLKGLETLAAAIPSVAARHPDVEFQLVGNDTRSAPDRGSMRRFIEAGLAAREALAHVRFTDSVPQSALVPMYHACAVFVLPSLNDVYPNAVLEAMGCGRPCVVSDAVGNAELVAEGDAGRVVPAGDAEALAAAIGELLSLPESQREEIGRRGRRAVERACATPVIAAQTLEAYRDAIRRPAPRRALASGGAQ
jgi:glycosyltransferase involved in cell wall biosynthesis